MNRSHNAPSDKTALLDTLIDRLGAAEAILVQGDDIDLTGLEDEVKRVCRAAENSAGPAAEPVVIRFQEITDRLDRIANLIQDRLNGVSGHSDHARARAIAAYAAKSGGDV